MHYIYIAKYNTITVFHRNVCGGIQLFSKNLNKKNDAYSGLDKGRCGRGKALQSFAVP